VGFFFISTNRASIVIIYFVYEVTIVRSLCVYYYYMVFLPVFAYGI
jgi:hypothetical protein